MENLTIYNVYVEMTSQEQCDRMKQLCIDNDLNICNDENAFEYCKKKYWIYFKSDFSCREFFVSGFITGTKVTEEQFIELLKNK